MEFYQLEYFRVLCKHGNYTLASRELNVSQPAVSMAVKKLEEECGGHLIDRSRKSFFLTQRGEVLLKWAVAVHNDMECLRSELDAFLVKKREIVRLAFPMPLCPDLLNEIAGGALSNRGISLHLHQDGHTSIVSNLLNGSVDVGIIGKDFLVPALAHHAFRKVEYWACFSPDHKFSGLPSVSHEMLKGETIIIPKTENSISKAVLDIAIRHGFRDRLQYLDVIPENTGSLAARGGGVALMPKHACRGSCAPLDPPLYCELAIAWNQGRSLTRETRMTVEYLKELADQPEE